MYGNSNYIEGYFSSTNDYALVALVGKVGIGTDNPFAKMNLKGHLYSRHFYYGSTEDTYIRVAKTGSKVIINDLAGFGSVGIGISSPNELLDVNGRMRIGHNGSLSGVWFSNSTNNLSTNDGSFYGMKTYTETGIYIGNNCRFWFNNLVNSYLREFDPDV